MSALCQKRTYALPRPYPSTPGTPPNREIEMIDGYLALVARPPAAIATTRAMNLASRTHRARSDKQPASEMAGPSQERMRFGRPLRDQVKSTKLTRSAARGVDAPRTACPASGGATWPRLDETITQRHN